MKRIISAVICFLLFTSVLSVSAVSPLGDKSNIPYTTYNYMQSDNYLAQAEKAMYSVDRVLNSTKIGVEKFGELNDICSDSQGNIYILDGKTSRIIVLDENLSLKTVLKSVNCEGKPLDFTGARGVFVSTDGKLYIADTENARVLISDLEGGFKGEILLPDSSLIPEKFDYRPIKVCVDSSGYTYILSDGSYYGAILYSPELEFLGFYGANSVEITVTQFITNLWKKITLTDAKREVSVSRLPYQFVDLYVDKNDFIYTATGITGSAVQKGQIKQLSAGGSNILGSGDTIFGDYDVSVIDGVVNTQDIAGVSVDGNDFIYCYDATYGRIFLYDSECRLLSAFGGGMGDGSQKGTFSRLNSIDIINNGDYIIVGDGVDLDITVFKITDYGRLIKKADSMMINGDYEGAEPLWQEVLTLNCGSQLANTGLAKAAIQRKDYKKAIKYAELANDKEIYSQAFTYIRKNSLKKSFNIIISAVILVIAAAAGLIVLLRKGKRFTVKNRELGYVLSAPLHPVAVFSEIKRLREGSIPLGIGIAAVFYVTSILKNTASGFLFRPLSQTNFNSLLVFMQTVGFVALWTVINWAVATLLGGIGKIKEIFVVITYSLVPMILGNIVYIIFSYMLNLIEGGFLNVFVIAMTLLTVFMVVLGSIVVHDISFGRFLAITVITLIGILIVVFLILLVILLVQQTGGFIGTLVRELWFR